jgi:hypothetical protein
VSGATAARDQAIGTIANDETIFSIQNAQTPMEVIEGNPGGTAVSATFKVVRSNGSAAGSVQFSTVPGTGISGAGPADFTTVNQTISFAAGETEKTIVVPITSDLSKENTETFSVQLSNPTNGVIGADEGTRTVRIVDNDVAPTLSVDDVRIVEGTGTQPRQAVFTVRLSAANETTPVRVNVATRDITATSSGTAPDFTANATTLEFAPGETVKSFSVAILGDSRDEVDLETFAVDLTGAENAAISDDSAIATIEDDDATPTLSFQGDVAIQEGAPGATGPPYSP